MNNLMFVLCRFVTLTQFNWLSIFEYVTVKKLLVSLNASLIVLSNKLKMQLVIIPQGGKHINADFSYRAQVVASIDLSNLILELPTS